MSTTGSDRLARAVSARRGELNLTQEEFAARGDITARTVQRVENGEQVRRSTLAKIDRAAGWSSGSSHTILDGGDPVITEDAMKYTATTESYATYLLAIWGADGRNAMIAEFKNVAKKIGNPQAKAALLRAVEMNAQENADDITRMAQ